MRRRRENKEMADTYEITYILKLKVKSTSKSEARVICDQWLAKLPTNDDTVFEFTAEYEDTKL